MSMNPWNDWLLTLFVLAIFCTLPMVLLGIHGLPGAPAWLWSVQAGVLLACGVGVGLLIRSKRIRPVWKCILAFLSYVVAMFCSNYICIEVCRRCI